MRSLRSRLTVALCALVILTSALSLVLSALTRNGLILQREYLPFAVFGFSLRDVLLLTVILLALAAIIVITMRTTADPIRKLSRATQEIAAGNYDVNVHLKEQVEEFGELERNFNLMVSQLKSEEYLRKDFIANVSHELKTPLSLLSGYAALLQEEDLPEAERREYARVVAEESARLTALIDNMLRLSRMDNQKIRPRSETFALDEQLRQAVLSLEPRWSEKDQHVEADLPEAEYTGDRELLFQIWTNLLDNAVRYTPEGGTITVSLLPSAERMTVTVEDNGPGMDKAVLERVFELFYRGESDRSGSGLGLPLARRIAELHGGTLTAESEPGRGSRFTVTLPLDVRKQS